VLFDKTTKGIEGAVYYAGIRHKVIANNIANMDTPGYKALDISFRDQLEYLLETEENGISASRVVRDLSSTGTVSPPPPTVMFAPDINSLWPRMDRNTVNIDQELTKLSQNAILHNTCLQLLKSKFGILKSVIRESGR